MTNSELLALLTAEHEETQAISAGIDTLLTKIGEADNVPQDVVDAANQLKTDLDTANAKFSAPAPPVD